MEFACTISNMLMIIAESEEDLQRGLDNLNRYCHEHFIEVNVSKTKVQIFYRGRLPSCSFDLNGRPLEIVKNFIYLGFGFSTQLSFTQHVQTINSRARAKCGLLFAKLPIINLPLNLVIDLFSVRKNTTTATFK